MGDSRRIRLRLGSAWFAVLVGAPLLAMCLCSCGGSGVRTDLAVKQSSANSSSVQPETAAMPRMRGDEDDDEPPIPAGGESGPRDADGDRDQDTPQTTYFDADDGTVRAYGSAAASGEAQAIAAVADRYLAAAAASNGAKACALVFSLFEEAIPEDYGRNKGPRYARGTTCPTVMSAIFRHEHRRYGASFAVVAVRLEGNRTLALLASRNAPASYLALQREGSAWKIDSPFLKEVP